MVRQKLLHKYSYKLFLGFCSLLIAFSLFPSLPASAHPKWLLFPVVGGGPFSNDFYSPRSNGIHQATDIFAPKKRQVVAAVAGTVTFMPLSQPSYGYMVTIRDADGFKYDYIHLNNDNPGTDDASGGPFHAYAPDVGVGTNVVKGQFIGYVGDSGNAENTDSHLHFEITSPQGEKINPYPYLVEAQRVGAPSTYPALPGETLPYGPAVTVLPSIAMGKFDQDANPDMVVGAGPGGGPHVRVIRSDGVELGGFYAYSPDFRGGINVAAGDVDGDGIDEIITAPVGNGGPHVRVFKLNGTELGGFYAYDPNFNGGVSVAATDVDGDGRAEVVAGAGPGGGPHVRILKFNGVSVAGFYAYKPDLYIGVDVAAGNVDAANPGNEIVTTPGPGAGPHVRIFTTNGIPLGSGFSAYSNFTGGARVSVGNVRTNTPTDEILVSPWANGGPHFRLFTNTGSVVAERLFYESWWNGKYDVAAGTGKSYTATGFNRRSSIRPGL